MPVPILLGRTVPVTGLVVDFGRMIDYLWMKNKDDTNQLLVRFDQMPTSLQDSFEIRPESGLDIGGLNIRYVFVRSFIDIDRNDMALWLKAGNISGLNDGDPVAVWPDGGPLGNNAVQANPLNQPVYRASAQNGLPGVEFANTGGQWLDFLAAIPNVTAAFWVAKLDPAPPALSFWLGSAGEFYPGPGQLMWDPDNPPMFPTKTSPLVLGGVTQLNGVAVDGTTTNRSNAAFEVWSLQTAGPVPAASLANDSAMPGASVNGTICELIVFDVPLTVKRVREVECYLSRKYNIPLTPPVLDIDCDLIGVNMVLGSLDESRGGSARAATPYPFYIQQTESVAAKRRSQSLIPRRGIYCDWVTNSMGGDAGADSPIYY